MRLKTLQLSSFMCAGPQGQPRNLQEFWFCQYICPINPNSCNHTDLLSISSWELDELSLYGTTAFQMSPLLLSFMWFIYLFLYTSITFLVWQIKLLPSLYVSLFNNGNFKWEPMRCMNQSNET